MHFNFHVFTTASPTFIEAPSDVEVNEGGSVKLPCRAQGRPKPRIIWDRIGNSAISQLHQSQMSSKTTQYFEKDTQEDLLTKAKIMSLRLKRSISPNQYSIGHVNVDHMKVADMNKNLALMIDRSKRNKGTQSTFDQIMRNENREIAFILNRKKRQVNSNDGKNDDIVADGGDNRSADFIPILVFSTQSPQDTSRLQITDNGELILLDITERDQVNVV